jgi:hypothetical protein
MERAWKLLGKIKKENKFSIYFNLKRVKIIKTKWINLQLLNKKRMMMSHKKLANPIKKRKLAPKFIT